MRYKQGMKKDYRTRPRRPMRYKAWLQTASDSAAQPCSLSDVSEGGARLEIEGAQAIPSEVSLLVAERSEGRPARVIWRSERELGLRFDKPATAGNTRLKR
jgi:hypothetical protein